MSDYAKIAVRLVASEASDYSEPYLREEVDTTLTPDEAYMAKVEVGFAASQTFKTSDFATVTSIVVYNTDATNFVTCTFRSAGNSAVNNILRVAAGKTLVLTDFTAANDLTLQADTAAVTVKVWVTGT